MPAQALRGVRILDLTQIAAGPYSTLLLGFMGAEIIKVESCRRADTSRGAVQPRPHQFHLYPDRDPGEHPWNRAAAFLQRNRYKLGISLDVTAPEGKALFLKLAAQSDALIENYRAAVMERWGLGYEALGEVAPHLVYLKMSSQGSTGPERNYGSLGYTMECLGGLASITGYLNGDPLMSNETYPDPVAGVLGVGALLAGLRHRRKTGRGSFIDLSQREVTTCLVGEAVMDFTMNQRVQQPIGNRHQAMAPHGVYPCVGEDSWVAIAVSDDQEWSGLCRALGDAPWTQDPKFATTRSRLQHQDELDRQLTAWTAQRDRHQAMHMLQAHGVPAGAVLTGSDVVQDPHLMARNWWDRSSAPEVDQTYAYVSTPWAFDRSPRQPGRPAPTLGQHNGYVYQELLGLSQEEISELEANGVIGTTPLWE